jgi:hypothetical protein
MARRRRAQVSLKRLRLVCDFRHRFITAKLTGNWNTPGSDFARCAVVSLSEPIVRSNGESRERMQPTA